MTDFGLQKWNLGSKIEIWAPKSVWSCDMSIYKKIIFIKKYIFLNVNNA
jgi:hypothetical protein